MGPGPGRATQVQVSPQPRTALSAWVSVVHSWNQLLLRNGLVSRTPHRELSRAGATRWGSVNA